MTSSSLMHDYYEVLEIEVHADANAIKASYRRLAKLRHPDKNLENSQATANFQLVGAPYYLTKDLN